jgi:4-carboxymuconolactone decarboxylase
MADDDTPTRALQLIGDFAPKLVSLTDDVLFGDIWARAELSPRDRSLITVAALITGGNTEQLTGHLQRARENGVTDRDRAQGDHHPSRLLRRLAQGDVRGPGRQANLRKLESRSR